MVPLVLFTGLGLYHLGFPLIAKCVEVGIPELVFMIVIQQDICSDPVPMGPPTVRAGEIFATVMAAFVASTELYTLYSLFNLSTGLYLEAARYGSTTPVPPSVISRGIGWLAVTGATATAENVGHLALTKAGSRRVVQISAAFMIFFSILGKFGAIFASIPLPIMAGYTASALVTLNKACIGIFHILGAIPVTILPRVSFTFFDWSIHTHATWLNDILCILFMSHATVAALIALVLDCSLPHGSDGAHKDNGAYWWE
ncbi:nucleobase-ascorbate transporter 10, partial [Olea europaea subsp. europaea]